MDTTWLHEVYFWSRHKCAQQSGMANCVATSHRPVTSAWTQLGASGSIPPDRGECCAHTKLAAEPWQLSSISLSNIGNICVCPMENPYYAFIHIHIPTYVYSLGIVLVVHLVPAYVIRW